MRKINIHGVREPEDGTLAVFCTQYDQVLVGVYVEEIRGFMGLGPFSAQSIESEGWKPTEHSDCVHELEGVYYSPKEVVWHVDAEDIADYVRHEP